MTRGDLYLVRRPGSSDPRRRRAFVVISRQVLVDSRYSTVVCAPVYTATSGLSTQVAIGTEAGLKHDSAIHCDELVSISKSRLRSFLGSLPTSRMRELDRALAIAVGLA